jgi:hypothetical protein
MGRGPIPPQGCALQDILRVSARPMLQAGTAMGSNPKPLSAVQAPQEVPVAQPGLVIVAIPCPSGKHPRSIVTYIGHVNVVMFCRECEEAWEVAASHPALRGMRMDPSG